MGLKQQVELVSSNLKKLFTEKLFPFIWKCCSLKETK
jgi:hypothetical protein